MRSNTTETMTIARRLGILPTALLLLIAGSAWSQEAPKPATDPPPQSGEQQAETPAQPAAESETAPAPDPAKPPDASAGAEPANAEGRAEPGADAPKRFIPDRKSVV